MVVLVMVVLQIGFAGYGAFYVAHKLEDEGSTIDDKVFEDGFSFHSGFGYVVILAGLILMIIGIIAGVGKWRLGKHGLLFLLLFVQLWLAWIGFELPFPVGFLHPINAFLILALTLWIVWGEWERRKTISGEPAAAPA
jgi:ABC-type branched-subunit amino acid transport system permease subunit